MELLQLKYFCHGAESENFSATAQKFGVPPSNISQCIKRLEQELGRPLFERCANRVRLNEQGRRFYEQVSCALQMIEEAKTALQGARPTLNLCINANRRIVMKAVEEYQRSGGEAKIKTTFFSDPTAAEFDLIISPAEGRLKGFQRERLVTEQLAIAAGKQSSIGQSERLDLKALQEEPFIAMSEGSSLYRLTEQICADFGFAPKITLQSEDPFYLRKCVELGLGVSLVPLFSWQGQFSEEITLHPLPGYTRDTFLYWNAKRSMPAAAKELICLLRKFCEENGTPF